MKPSKGLLYRYSKLCCYFLMATCLFSCSSTPEKLNIDHPLWQIKGKIGYKHTEGKSGSASFSWIEGSDSTLIHSFGPFGQSLFTLFQTPNQAIYQQADGRRITATNAETLLKKMSSFSFPIHNASFWIQGKLQGSETDIHYDEHNRINTFIADTWQVSLHYKSSQARPRKISLNNDNTHLTIIIKNYELF